MIWIGLVDSLRRWARWTHCRACGHQLRRRDMKWHFCPVRHGWAHSKERQ